MFLYLNRIFSYQYLLLKFLLTCLTIHLSIYQLWLLQSLPLSEPRDNPFSSIHLRDLVFGLTQLFLNLGYKTGRVHTLSRIARLLHSIWFGETYDKVMVSVPKRWVHHTTTKHWQFSEHQWVIITNVLQVAVKNLPPINVRTYHTAKT